MKNKIALLFIYMIFSSCIIAQGLSDFELFDLEKDSFLNGNDLNGGFQDGILFFPNDYNTQWKSWSGWAITASTDTTTRGFTNQFASISGHGNNNSQNYAISYAFDPVRVTDGGTGPRSFISLFINNATYSYWSMKEGDGVAKKFGGPSGNDPDYYYLSIHGYFEGELTKDSVNFYLADFRSDNNDDDYIINEWTEVSLSKLGAIDSIEFTTYSSDVGMFGINTPTYFCVDDVQVAPGVWNKEFLDVQPLAVYPTLTADFVNFKEPQSGKLNIISQYGQVIYSEHVTKLKELNLAGLTSGLNFMTIESKETLFVGKVIVKQ